jgi:hypothetical protein
MKQRWNKHVDYIENWKLDAGSWLYKFKKIIYSDVYILLHGKERAVLKVYLCTG